MFRDVTQGARVAPLAQDAGDHERKRVKEAKAQGIAYLDSLCGYPGAEASQAEILAWYAAGLDEDETSTVDGELVSERTNETAFPQNP